MSHRQPNHRNQEGAAVEYVPIPMVDEYAPLPTVDDGPQMNKQTSRNSLRTDAPYQSSQDPSGFDSQKPVRNSVFDKLANSSRSPLRHFRRQSDRTSLASGPKPITEVMQGILNNILFQTTMAFLIVANAFVIGLETDYPKYPLWPVVEDFFLVVFTCEVCFRICAYGTMNFFDYHSSDFLWNMFDLMIVSLGLFDATAEIFSPPNASKKKNSGISTLFRMIRLLRILRIFKIIRFLKQLYLLAYGFIEAAQAVMWVSLLMLFVLYICAIVLTRTVGDIPEDDANYTFLHSRFGSLRSSMLTLFELMSQPDIRAYEPVQNQYPFLLTFLIVFVIFGSFGMIALLTGVISESMFEKNQLRVDSERIERETRRKFLMAQCSDLFETAPQNEYGEVNPEDLLRLQGEVEKILLDGNVSFVSADLEAVIYLMDSDDSGAVSRQEFLHGVLSIAEDIRPMSIMELFHLTSILNTKINANQRTLKKVEEQNESIQAFLQIPCESARANGHPFVSENMDIPRENTENYKSAGNPSKGGATAPMHLQGTLEKIEDACRQTQEQMHLLTVRINDSMVATGMANRRERSRDPQEVYPSATSSVQNAGVQVQVQMHTGDIKDSHGSGIQRPSMTSSTFIRHDATLDASQMTDSIVRHVEDTVSRECQKSMAETKQLLQLVVAFFQNANDAKVIGTQSALGYAPQSSRSALGYAPPSHSMVQPPPGFMKPGLTLRPCNDSIMDWAQFVVD